MAQRNRRTSKKKQQLTYEDIKDLSPEQLEQMGLGSWLKDNVGNVLQTAGGIGLGLAGALTANPALIAGGVSMGVAGASGFAETAGQKEQMELQEQQIQHQNALGAANTNLQNKLNQNPLVNYVPTRRRGGKLPKYQMGSDPLSNPKAYIPPTESVSNSMSRLRGETTADVEAYLAGDPDVALQHTSFPDQIYHLRQINDPYSEYHGGYEVGFNLRANNGRVNAPIERIKAADWVPFMQTHRKNFIGPYSKYLDAPEPKQMAMGGTINYGGQLHEGPNGGVPVDAQGNPNAQNPVALVEKGEVKYDTGEGDYIFSDQLELRKGKTFAKKAKDIQAKYKMRMSEGVITDPIAKKGYDKEMQDLVKKQEKLRSIVAPQEQPMMRTGGDLPKYDGVSRTPTGTQQLPWTSEQLQAFYRRQNEPRVAQYNQETYGIDPNAFNTKLAPVGEDPILTLAKSQFGTNMINHKIGLNQPPVQQSITPEQEANIIKGFQASQQRYQDGLEDREWDRMINEYNATDITPMQHDIIKSNTPEDAPKKNLYQGQNWTETGLQMIPGIASGISNILMAKNRKKAAENMTKLQAPQVVAQQINLEPARAGIREQGNVARANTSRGLRGASATPGQYMSNMVAAETGIQRGVGEGINQLNIQEQTQNAASRQSADIFNAQMQARADEINNLKEQQVLADYYNQLAGGIGQIGQGVSGALSTKASSSQAANMMQMMHPNYNLTVAPGVEVDPNASWVRRGWQNFRNQLDYNINRTPVE